MKTVICTMLLCVNMLIVNAQIIDDLPKDEQGNLNFNEVVQIDSASKDQLYFRAKEFFANTFKSAKDVIQLDDKDAGVVIGKGYSPFSVKSVGTNVQMQMWYTIKIQSKDGRYKAEIYDISYKGQLGTNYPSNWFDKKYYYKNNGQARDMNEKYKIVTVSEVNAMLNSIQTAMKKASTKTSSKNDW